MKVSTIIGIILSVSLIGLFFMAILRVDNIEIIKVFGDLVKVLAGGLAGALAGEKHEK